MSSSGRVAVGGGEAFAFMGCLVAFALWASSYVLQRGLDEGRPLGKLILECALIITSVLPPELPTELSLAINTSLQALRKLGNMPFFLDPRIGDYKSFTTLSIIIISRSILHRAFPHSLGRTGGCMLL